MELVSEEKNSITIKIIGEDHTLCNVLRKTLHQDENVVAASYAIEHPLIEHPKFYVQVKKGRPGTALTRAAEQIAAACDDLHKQLFKALKK